MSLPLDRSAMRLSFDNGLVSTKVACGIASLLAPRHEAHPLTLNTCFGPDASVSAPPPADQVPKLTGAARQRTAAPMRSWHDATVEPVLAGGWGGDGVSPSCRAGLG